MHFAVELCFTNCQWNPQCGWVKMFHCNYLISRINIIELKIVWCSLFSLLRRESQGWLDVWESSRNVKMQWSWRKDATKRLNPAANTFRDVHVVVLRETRKRHCSYSPRAVFQVVEVCVDTWAGMWSGWLAPLIIKGLTASPESMSLRSAPPWSTCTHLYKAREK